MFDDSVKDQVTLTRRGCCAAMLGALPLALAGGSRAMARPAPAYTDKFTAAFEPGFTWNVQLSATSAAMKTEFKVIDGGELTMPSGRLVACDPFVGPERPAFTQEVPKGKARLRFAYPLLHGEQGGRVAFARLDFSQVPVARWDMALIAGQDVATLKPDEIFGYPVDAGTGSFGDAEAFAALQPLLKSDNTLSEGWIADGERAGKDKGMSWFLDKTIGPSNILMFESGWGDGFYASYFGFDSKGRVVCLLTDFQVIDWSKG